MPIYRYKCEHCGRALEIFKHRISDRNMQACLSCGKPMRRALEKETIHVRSDIEPGYQQSLGVHVGSRREWREELAKRNAYDPGLMQNSNPSDGRLVAEERMNTSRETIFSKRRRAGWGNNPDPDEGATIEGEADYSEIINYAKRRAGRS